MMINNNNNNRNFLFSCPFSKNKKTNKIKQSEEKVSRRRTQQTLKRQTATFT